MLYFHRPKMIIFETRLSAKHYVYCCTNEAIKKLVAMYIQYKLRTLQFAFALENPEGTFEQHEC